MVAVEEGESVVEGIVGIQLLDEAHGVVAVWHGGDDNETPFLASLEMDGDYEWWRHDGVSLRRRPDLPHQPSAMRLPMSMLLDGTRRLSHPPLGRPMEWLHRSVWATMRSLIAPRGVNVPTGLLTDDLVDEVLTIEVARHLATLAKASRLPISSGLARADGRADEVDLDAVWADIATESARIVQLRWSDLSVADVAELVDSDEPLSVEAQEWWGPDALGAIAALQRPWVPESLQAVGDANADLRDLVMFRLAPLVEARLVQHDEWW